MFSHIFVSVSNFERALTFYQPVMRSLGLKQRWLEADRPWAGWHSTGETRPFFVICQPFDGKPQHPGNGQMVAFMAKDRETVRIAHAVALKNGGANEGVPGLRPEYHSNYFGAYFRDLDGNKLCVACHEAESES